MWCVFESNGYDHDITEIWDQRDISFNWDCIGEGPLTIKCHVYTINSSTLVT